MSDSSRKQQGTSPGFGPPPEPLPPLHDESSSLDDETISDHVPPSPPVPATMPPSAAQPYSPGAALPPGPPNHESLPIHPALGSSALARAVARGGAEQRSAEAPRAAEPPRAEPARAAEPRAAERPRAPQVVHEQAAPMQIPMPVAPDAIKRGKGTPAVDIDLIYERRSAPLPDQPWIFLEVWTRNTVYQLDSHMVCVDVLDQATRRSISDHALRGARLVGGQSRDGESMELSHPFPRPGSEAVFEQASGRQVRFSQTSTVTRVVMRLRVLTVAPDQLLPTWEEVTGKLNAERRR